MRFPSVFHCAHVSFITCLFLHTTAIQSHGFEEWTYVRTCENTWYDSIRAVVEFVVNKHKRCVASYDTATQRYVQHAVVTNGGKGTVPWYVNFSCIPDCTNDISCSPIQEFYCPDNNTWVPAYKLKLGDTVLSYDGPCTIKYLQYVEKELEVYALAVEKPHTFFVGHSNAHKKWDEITKPFDEIIDGIDAGAISCRDALKAGVAFGTGWRAHGKLLGGLGKLYRGIKTRVIEFAKNNPLMPPQEYMQTSDGSLLKISYKMMQPDKQKGKNLSSGNESN
jgi:hypothetical protein